jgi:anti-sigma regulatory factor (Ser/Thr protein kinase)
MGDADCFHISLRNDLSELARVNVSVHQFLEPDRASSQALYRLDLAIEELLTNIIKYGYDDANPHEVSLTLRLLPEHLVLTIEDDGHEFNPVRSATPDLGQAPEDRKTGGLGLHMVREMSDKMEYWRRNGRNVVQVTIRRS